jgi:hypothetical protein
MISKITSMGIIIHGTNKVAIGVDELMIECPSCEVHNFADFMIFSVYHHIYWIPFFPARKEVLIICKKCGLHRNGLTFDSRTLGNFAELKSKFKHPFISYIGIILFLVFIIYLIIDLAK